MKALGLFFLLLAPVILGYASWEYYDAPRMRALEAEERQSVASLDEKFEAYYRKPAKKKLAVECAGLVKEFAAYTCTEDQIETILTMLVQESNLTPGAVGDDGISVGIGQTHKRLKPMIRKRWKALGVWIGPPRSLRRELAYTVMEFRMHLEEARGNVKEAVRRYNGSGPKARRYAQKVLENREAIFGRHAEVGEKSISYKACQ